MANKKYPKENVLYAYLTAPNERYLEFLAKRYSQSKSYIVNQMLEAHKNRKLAVFEKRVPKFVKKAESWKAKNG
jgi:hypothetical protein